MPSMLLSSLFHSRSVVLALALSAWAWAAEEDPELADSANANLTKSYEPPSVTGYHWAETFDGDVWKRWTQAKNEKYNGKFEVAKRKTEGLVGDVGLLVPTEARHYGVSTSFKPIVGEQPSFSVQFEVRFQDGLSCGGSYIKLFDSEGAEAGTFNDQTRYVIMFGPDKCGSTDKVHFILQHKSPKTGKWEEKHWKDAPKVPYDQLTHLYGLTINKDNSVEITIDGQSKSTGSLLENMEPPINPPKEIDDPEDKKPGDWVDEAKIDDPTSAKPDDWDEDAPSMIVDTTKKMPDGWLEDEEKRIADPTAKQPDDWDDEEDGEWEAPIIDNPACKVGCGKWEPPKISNPAYKGKWYAPKIDNPEYKGVWKPKQIANPDYFYDDKPAVLPTIDSVGIDIWTMSGGMIFDNVLISADKQVAKAFTEQTFKLRKEVEEAQDAAKKGGSGSLKDKVLGYASNPIAIFVTIAVVLLTTMWCCCMRSDVPRAPTKEERRSKKEKKEKEAKKESDENSKEEEKKTEEKDEIKETKKKEEEQKKEGGLGDIDGDS